MNTAWEGSYAINSYDNNSDKVWILQSLYRAKIMCIYVYISWVSILGIGRVATPHILWWEVVGSWVLHKIFY